MVKFKAIKINKKTLRIYKIFLRIGYLIPLIVLSDFFDKGQLPVALEIFLALIILYLVILIDSNCEQLIFRKGFIYFSDKEILTDFSSRLDYTHKIANTKWIDIDLDPQRGKFFLTITDTDNNRTKYYISDKLFTWAFTPRLSIKKFYNKHRHNILDNDIIQTKLTYESRSRIDELFTNQS